MLSKAVFRGFLCKAASALYGIENDHLLIPRS